MNLMEICFFVFFAVMTNLAEFLPTEDCGLFNRNCHLPKVPHTSFNKMELLSVVLGFYPPKWR